MKKSSAILFTFLFITALLVAASSGYAADTSKININEASVEQLQELPNVGPVIAQRIVDYRKDKPFSSPEDLMEVKGIGPKTFAELKDRISVE